MSQQPNPDYDKPFPSEDPVPGDPEYPVPGDDPLNPDIPDLDEPDKPVRPL